MTLCGDVAKLAKACSTHHCAGILTVDKRYITYKSVCFGFGFDLGNSYTYS
jgi:hypothetical protein